MRRFFLRIFCIRKISKKEGVSPIIRGNDGNGGE